MKVLLLVLLGSVGVLGGGAAEEAATREAMTLEEDMQAFAAWKKAHGKQYGSEREERMRFENFRKHVSAFQQGGNDGLRAAELPNSLADWATSEFNACLRGCYLTDDRTSLPPPPPEYTITEADIRSMPKSVDWRKEGVVTRVKNQGRCGSCWSFSATGAMESAWAVAGNPLVELSEQELVSCDTSGNYGCQGGWPQKAIDYVRDNGAATEESYPYVSKDGSNPSCSGGHTMSGVKVTGHYSVQRSEDAMAAAVAKYGPLSIAVEAMTNLWFPYKSGIMTGCTGTSVDHALLLVGYGVENGQKYWIIKNSWGTGWGESGYVRLERGSNQCGITRAPVLAVVERSGPPPSTPLPTPVPTPVPTPIPTPVPTPVPTRRRTPTPAPPAPTPAAGACPAECVASMSNGVTTCTWQNNTNGVVLPPPSTLVPVCRYFRNYGLFYYRWRKDTAPATLQPCPPTALYERSWGTQAYCVFYNRRRGLNIPSGATVDCSDLVSSGTFSYSYRS